MTAWKKARYLRHTQSPKNFMHAKHFAFLEISHALILIFYKAVKSGLTSVSNNAALQTANASGEPILCPQKTYF